MDEQDENRDREPGGAADGTRTERARTLAREIVRGVREDWRVVILAVVGALLGRLAAQALGGSEDAKTLGALLGAAAGAWLRALAERFKARDRTLTGLALVLSLLSFPRGRSAIADAAGSAPSTVATIGSNIAIVVTGAVLATAIASAAPFENSEPEHPLAGRWQATAPVAADGSPSGYLAETWDIAHRCRDEECAFELAAVTAANVRVPMPVRPTIEDLGDGSYGSVRTRSGWSASDARVAAARTVRNGRATTRRSPVRPRSIASS